MPANKQINNSDEKSPGRDETAQLLVPDANTHNKMFYIMTLGTTREVRRCGLGSVLVNRVVDMIEERKEVGALYLHVIIYNECAIRLYERLGFARVKEIKGERFDGGILVVF
jgi:ribosomal protein S18 acetylase RimI-like enzyme